MASVNSYTDLALGPHRFTIYSDAFEGGFGCVFIQNDKATTYTSKQLKSYYYLIRDLELLAVVFI